MVRKLVLVGLGAVATLAVAGVAAYFFWDYLLPSSEPENNARYYPRNVVAYTWVTLNPGEGQRRHMLDMFDRLGELSEFDDFRDRITDDLESGTAIDFENDIAPWVGYDLSAALVDVDLDRESVEFAATVGVRDEEAASRFLDNWLDYMEDETDADFDRDSYGDFAIWDDEDEFQVYALSDDLMLFATTRALMEDTIDRIEGDSDRTLEASEDFQNARMALPDRRFASFYVDVDRALDVEGDIRDEISDPFRDPSIVEALGGGFLTGGADIGESADDLCGGGMFDTPAWLAGSLGWIERGLVFELASPALDSEWPASPGLTDVAEKLPEDTVATFAVSFNPALDDWRSSLDRCDIVDIFPEYDYIVEEIAWSLGGDVYDQVAYRDDRTLADALDTGLLIVELALGIDLEEDLLDHLLGDAVLAVREFDFQDVAEDPEANPVEVMALLSYREGSEEYVADAMGDVSAELTDRTGADTNSVEVGEEARAYAFQNLIAAGAYSPGYAIHDGYLTFGATESSLQAAVEAQIRAEGSLASNAEYRRAVDHLPVERTMFGFVNINRIVSNIDRRDAGLSQGQYDLLSSLGATAMSASSDGGRDRFTVTLTMFPEE